MYLFFNGVIRRLLYGIQRISLWWEKNKIEKEKRRKEGLKKSKNKMATEQMKQHIAKQMKKMAKDLASNFESNPLYYETFYTITREESMVCEDFDAMVAKMFKEWEEKVRNKISDSNWEYITELEMDCSLEHTPCDSKGMPLEWIVSIEWTVEAFNPFE